jgi:hypothetical protein
MTVEIPMLMAMGQYPEVDLTMPAPPARVVTGSELLTTVESQTFGPAAPQASDFLGTEWLGNFEGTIDLGTLSRIELTESSPTNSILEQVRKVEIRSAMAAVSRAQMAGVFFEQTMGGWSMPAITFAPAVPAEVTQASLLIELGMPVEAMIDLTSEAATHEAWWRLTAGLRSETEFDARSLSLIRAKLLSIPAGAIPGEATDSADAFQEARRATITRTLTRLTDDVAADTARNEYDLHRRIHARLADGRCTDADTLNDWVYAELFLTPNADPWLGLAPNDVFSAIDAGGLSFGNEARAKGRPQTESKVSTRAATK